MSQRTHLVLAADLPRLHRPDEDAAWALAAEQAWGFCGVVTTGDRALTGYLLVCPPGEVPADHAQSAGSFGDRSAVLMEVRVFDAPALTPNQPVARQLLRSVAGHLGRRDVAGVETMASYWDPTPTTPPAEWLTSEGFEIVRSGVRPQLRLDLARTARLPDLGAWWQRAWSGWAAPASPEPAGRVGTPTPIGSSSAIG